MFQRLGVMAEAVRDGGDGYVLNWTPSQARAYQLLHVLLHESGHHHGRTTNRSKRNLARGERYAEQYVRSSTRLWDAYVREFGLE